MICPVCNKIGSHHTDLTHEFIDRVTPVGTKYWYIYYKNYPHHYNMIGWRENKGYYVCRDVITQNHFDLKIASLDIKDAPDMLIKFNKLRVFS